jgi:hypothetical protein
MPDPFTPSGQATPETAVRPFRGWLARTAGGLQPAVCSRFLPSWIPQTVGACRRRVPVQDVVNARGSDSLRRRRKWIQDPDPDPDVESLFVPGCN